MKKSLTETIIEELKISILSGEYQPGEKLPTLRELAELYNVSRSVINAVVVDLESNGYIKIVPTKWIEVADWKNEGNLSILADQVAFGLLDLEQLKDLLEARKFLELECVRKACQNAPKEHLARLRALIIEEESEDDPKKRARYDLLFHYAICKLSGNMVYGFIMKAFEASSIPLIEQFYSDHEVYSFVLDKHQCIADAIAAKNVTEAEKQMRLLLEHGETIIQRVLQGGNAIGSKV
ncbi:MAG: FadR family transcriptional regulator [Clostridia bacterium]|nr:FadR family transcriptional regulator [Clostridia bacterium]MBP5273064.1 FadR family transcriptional regulator [Clostridia bacterium]